MNHGLDILRDAYAHSGYRLCALILLLLLTGVSDGISMMLLYPLLEMVGMGTSTQANSGVLGEVFHKVFAWFGMQPTFANVSLILLASFLVQGILFTAQNWLLIDIQKKYIAAWQQQLFSDFMSAQWSYFVSQKLGEMVNVILVECPRLGAAFFAILQLIVAATILCIYLAIAFVVSWQLLLYLVAAALLLFVLVHPIRRATRRYGLEIGQINADMAATLNEMLGGAKLIKASAGEAKAGALMAGQIGRLRSNLTWSAFLPTTIRSGFEFAAILMILGALFYGLMIENVSAAQLLVLVALVARLFPRLMHIQQFHNLLNLCGPAYEVLLTTHARFASHREIQSSVRDSTTDLKRLLPATITAKNLVMRYGEKTVLDDVSFVIPVGQVVGFVGPSGAGKSTLVDAIMSLIVPSGGHITVGDKPLRDIDLVTWRRNVGYVSQDTFLFHDTIANNIRWSVPDAPMESVEAAAHAAGLGPFVSSLPLGYDTIVGDRGAKLSGGQRQRISVARALIRQPVLLVLDEATSALDSLSEREVMGVINSLRGKMTIVIVAHRLATVRDADFIYVLDHGRIVEQGAWTSLSGNKALFHRLMQAQAVGDHG